MWLSEFGEAYLEFVKKGYEVTVASPKGGSVPVDARSIENDTPKEILDTAMHLENTLRLSEVSDGSLFDAIFLPGGHGTMFDFPDNDTLKELIRVIYDEGKIVAAVCHGPAGLVEVILEDETPLVAGKKVTAFTNSEEKETTLDEHMPFLLESRLRKLGAEFIATANWTDHVQVDGNLITGQNPQSTISVAKEVIRKLG